MQIFSGVTSNENGEVEEHAETFLAVIKRFPLLVKARIIVCEVPSHGHSTTFADDLERLVDDHIRVLKPVWEPGDFYRLDPHLTPTGHRKLAHLIAAAILAN